MAVRLVPAHVNETTEPVDNLGGILSVVLVAALILAINFAPVPNATTRGADPRRRSRSSFGVALLPPAAPRRQPALRPAHREALGLLGGGDRGDHRVRLADGRDVHRPAVPAERARLLDARGRGWRSSRRRSAWCSSRRARRRSSRRAARGSRCSSGYVFCLLGFLTMLLLWKEDISYWKVGLGYAFIGIGVGLAGTPASHSLTGSVPVKRAGMASGTADLQRDLGGAIMQSIFGALLTAGYAAAAAAAIVVGAEQRQGQRQRPGAADEVVRRRRGGRAAVPAVREPDHGRREAVVPRRRPVGLHGRHRRDPRAARRSSSSASRAARRRSGCSPRTTPRTRRLAE